MDFGARHILLNEGPGLDEQASRAARAAVPESIYANPSEEELKAFLRGRVVDSNVVSVKVGSLLETPATKWADAPVECIGCKAVMSELSDMQGRHWCCEFCGEMNSGVKAPKAKRSAAKAGVISAQEFVLKSPASTRKDGNVIFCMDVSGSMGVTTEVQAGALFSPDGRSWTCSRCALRNAVNISKCNACGQSAGRTTTHVSRLDLMRRAVTARLDSLARESPKSRVGLIAFSDEVRIIGDGTRDTIVLPETSLYEEDGLRLLGMTDCTHLLEVPVRDSLGHLTAKIGDLSVGGQTALGPTLLLAIAMASQSGGSGRVVVCTDGLSNIGLGALTPNPHPDERAYSREYLNRVTQYAIDSGVCVSIISIEGEDCNLHEMGRLAEATGGNVIRVDATRLTESVSYATSEEILATRVRVRLLTHTRLQSYWLGHAIPSDQLYGLTGHEQLLGAVTSSTEAFFSFGSATVKQSRRLRCPPPLVTDDIPFQLQIVYMKADGTECLRVFSCRKSFGTLRSAVESTVNPHVISSFASNTAAALALEASYDDARAVGLAFRAVLSRCQTATAAQEDYAHAMEDLYGSLPAQAQNTQEVVPDKVASALFNIKKSSSWRFGWKGRKGKTAPLPAEEEQTEGFFNPMFQPAYDFASPGSGPGYMQVPARPPSIDRSGSQPYATDGLYEALPPAPPIPPRLGSSSADAAGFSNPLFNRDSSVYGDDTVQYVVPPMYNLASQELYPPATSMRPSSSPTYASLSPTTSSGSSLASGAGDRSRLHSNATYHPSFADMRTYDVASPRRPPPPPPQTEEPTYGTPDDLYDVLAHSPRTGTR